MSQNLDPAHFSEPGQEAATREDLFNAMDRLLGEKAEYKYFVLLADSGMGKSAFVLNYYARHLKRRKRFKLELLPLGIKDADARIAAIENEKYDYSYQIYEKMVDAWLEREEGKVENVEKKPLRDFCERLAIEIYLQREQHKGERMPIEAIDHLAKDFGLKIESWKLTGRSLLNRDAEDRFKFAHRSIMEYLFVKRFLELPELERPKVEWTDQMIAFLREMAREKLRSQAQTLSDGRVREMLQEKSFFDSTRNKAGTGIDHQYFEIEQKGSELIFDLATGLTWQQSGSEKYMTYADA